MEPKEPSERDLRDINRAHKAIKAKLSSGFNHYPKSIELSFQESVHLPIKCGHRDETFIGELERRLFREFGSKIRTTSLPRRVIYEYSKEDHIYTMPKPETGVRLWDVKQKRYLKDEEDYRNSSPDLLAVGEEKSIIFLTEPNNMVNLAKFLIHQTNAFLLDETGQPIPDESQPEGYAVNPYSVPESYDAPMIIVTHNLELERDLPEFAPVKKLYRIRGQEEISTYLDKTYEDFVKNCRMKFDGAVKRLANKIFRDIINFESKV